MPSCFECLSNFTCIKSLITHLKIIHNTNDYSFYRCAESECGRSFHSLNSFRKHIRNHSNEPVSEQNNVTVGCAADIVNNSPESEKENNSVPNTDFGEKLFAEMLHSTLVQFITKMYNDNTLTRKQVQVVLTSMISFLENIVETIKENLFKLLSSHHDVHYLH